MTGTASEQWSMDVIHKSRGSAISKRKKLVIELFLPFKVQWKQNDNNSKKPIIYISCGLCLFSPNMAWYIQFYLVSSVNFISQRHCINVYWIMKMYLICQTRSNRSQSKTLKPFFFKSENIKELKIICPWSAVTHSKKSKQGCCAFLLMHKLLPLASAACLIKLLIWSTLFSIETAYCGYNPHIW